MMKHSERADHVDARILEWQRLTDPLDNRPSGNPLFWTPSSIRAATGSTPRTCKSGILSIK